MAGCRALRSHSPTIDVMGSYFPVWMVCIVCGLALTVIARLLLIALKLDTHLYATAILYPCLLVIFASAIWLIFFQN